MNTKNPWNVDSVQAFSFLKCPECTFDAKEEDIFQFHAVENHPLSYVFFGKVFKEEEVKNHGENLASTDENSISENKDLIEDVEEEFTIKEDLYEEKSRSEDENLHSDYELPNSEEESGEEVIIPGSGNCHICGKFYKTDLKRHVASVHKKKKPFKCLIKSCKFAFADKSALRKHTSTVHEGKKPLKPFLCTICGVRCVAKATLKFHIENVHEGKKLHMCPKCGKSFSALASLNIHISTVHERKKPYQCSSCDKRFGLKNVLKKHMKKIHKKESFMVKS
jgi:hypothetical protein